MFMRVCKLMGLMIFVSFSRFCLCSEIPTSVRADKAIASVKPDLEVALRDAGLMYGSPIYIRIFKQSKELELWVKKGEVFQLFKTYAICTFSGRLGPKTKQGDNQAPEGFYFVKPSGLNPWSSYHLSFNLGYPNAYERFHGYTGSALMVHGKCVSIGCYAMTDESINEIYAMAYGAFQHGQPFFRVHAFPFRMDGDVLNRYQSHKWFNFWKNLKEGYDFFSKYKVPPNVTVENLRYQFSR